MILSKSEAAKCIATLCQSETVSQAVFATADFVLTLTDQGYDLSILRNLLEEHAKYCNLKEN